MLCPPDGRAPHDNHVVVVSSCPPPTCSAPPRFLPREPARLLPTGQLANKAAFRAGAKPVSVEIVDGVLSRAIDDLEPRLIGNGYDATTLAREFGASVQTSGFAVPAEIRTFLAGTLGADRTRELTDQMRVAGVPL